jgi:cytochrome c553
MAMVNNKIFTHVSTILSLLLIACAPEGPHMPVQAAKDSPKSTTTSQVTDFEQVREIFANRCLRCHNSGDKNWAVQASAEKWAKSGAMPRALANGIMPLKGSPEATAITPDERNLLLAWIEGLSGGNSTLAKSGASTTAMPAIDKTSIVEDKNLAFVSRCMSCHGPTGTSGNDTFPNIAAHGPEYFIARIKEYLDPNNQTIMGMQIKALAEEFAGSSQSESWNNLVSYAMQFFTLYNVQVNSSEMKSKLDSLDTANKKLYADGKKIVNERCVACHSQGDLRPLDNAPMIFAQKLPYLKARLDQFKSGTGGLVMPAMVSTLSKEQLEAIAIYLSHTPPGLSDLISLL